MDNSAVSHSAKTGVFLRPLDLYLEQFLGKFRRYLVLCQHRQNVELMQRFEEICDGATVATFATTAAALKELVAVFQLISDDGREEVITMSIDAACTYLVRDTKPGY